MAYRKCRRRKLEKVAVNAEAEKASLASEKNDVSLKKLPLVKKVAVDPKKVGAELGNQLMFR